MIQKSSNLIGQDHFSDKTYVFVYEINNTSWWSRRSSELLGRLKKIGCGWVKTPTPNWR